MPLFYKHVAPPELFFAFAFVFSFLTFFAFAFAFPLSFLLYPFFTFAFASFIL
jgi:hypothetical protein